MYVCGEWISSSKLVVIVKVRVGGWGGVPGAKKSKKHRNKSRKLFIPKLQLQLQPARPTIITLIKTTHSFLLPLIHSPSSSPASISPNLPLSQFLQFCCCCCCCWFCRSGLASPAYSWDLIWFDFLTLWVFFPLCSISLTHFLFSAHFDLNCPASSLLLVLLLIILVDCFLRDRSTCFFSVPDWLID